MKFVADTMLEKLARWLRIIGCDVIFDSSKSVEDLIDIANRENRVFLSRRKSFPVEKKPEALFDLCEGGFAEQFKKVIVHFDIDYMTKLFSRCTECNAEVVLTDKNQVRNIVPEMSWRGFNEFFQCPKCKKVYWRGAHLDNTINKLKKILGSEL